MTYLKKELKPEGSYMLYEELWQCGFCGNILSRRTVRIGRVALKFCNETCEDAWENELTKEIQ